MAKNALAPKFDKVKRASGTAFDIARKLTGTNTSKEFREYKKLNQANFQTLADVYGQDVVADYIKHMEAERIKNAKQI